jgi:hypothetical protein
MAKLTKEQYNKWNAQAKNGFQFDFRYFILHNEKTFCKISGTVNTDEELKQL